MSRYIILAKRNSKKILLLIALFVGLLILSIYLFIRGSWFSMPIAFVNGLYTLYLLLKIDDLLGFSTVTYKNVSNISEMADKAATANEIEDILESYNIGYHLPDRVDVTWKDSVDQQSFIQNEKEIIKLDDSSHLNENVCKAVLRFTRRNIVHHVRTLLHPKVHYGLDGFVATDIFKTSDMDKEYIDVNETKGEVFQKLIEEFDEDIGTDLSQIHNELDNIRDGGFFGPVLLREYSKLSETGWPKDDVREETRDFVRFLDQLSTQANEKRQLAYPGDTFNVAIGIVGGRDKEYYESLAKISFARYDTTYILAEGEYISKAEEIHDGLHELPGVNDYDTTYYEFRPDSRFDEGFCAQYEVPVGNVPD